MEFTKKEYAQKRDEQDPLRHFRDQFLFPSKADLARTRLARVDGEKGSNEKCIYLCGNSLGLQTVLARKYFDQYLETWAQKGVYGHFKSIDDSALPLFLNTDSDLQADMAAIVGAKTSEVALMQTLTVNLHLMMISFFRPTKERWKIIIEGKAFPSDHFAVESQLRHHKLNPSEAMIVIEPPSKDSPLIPTEHILSVIDKHASETALLLLPGIQFYTGQLLDMPRITAYAQSKGITVGWDLAHAVGNVPMQLHDWNVDFAVWCTYKYLNAGPGSMGGCFVHERHSQVDERTTTGDAQTDDPGYLVRLAGWWGSSKATRFAMDNRFIPIAGAAGWQISNTSVADGTALRATLDVFKQTDMHALRAKSLDLTAYLEQMLDALRTEQGEDDAMGRRACFAIITPRDPQQRGVQLSLRLDDGLLDAVMHVFEAEGVVLDERKPNVIRVAPAPLYNSYVDVWDFVQVFRRACRHAVAARGEGKDGADQ